MTTCQSVGKELLCRISQTGRSILFSQIDYHIVALLAPPSELKATQFSTNNIQPNENRVLKDITQPYFKMTETVGSKMCSYMYAVSSFFISEIVLIFGYQNNAWLVIRNTETIDEFQRGLNDDCYKGETGIHCQSWKNLPSSYADFPSPFNTILKPSKELYLVLYLARLQLLIPIAWFIISILCCCNIKIEKVAYKYKKILIYICVFGVFIFICIFVIMMISLTTSSILPVVPSEYDLSLGVGFWLFVAAGFVLYLLGVYFFYQEDFNKFMDKFRMHHQLQQEQELQAINA